MDSLRGIPVEYKLDAFNMPRTGTTLCHPKIGYVDLSVISLSTRMEITPTLPKYQTWNSWWYPKFNSYNCNNVFRQKSKKHNPSHIRRHTLLSQPSQLLMTQFRLNTHNLSRVLQHQKQTQIFHAANKNLIIKHISTLAILLLHHPPFISHKLSEGTNNTKRGNNST